jgi:hypothetical protein
MAADAPAVSPLPEGSCLRRCALWWTRGGAVSTRMMPRHARSLAVGRWAARIADHGSVPSPLNDHAVLRQPSRRDPLLEPVAITEHCYIGDQIRVPAAWCDMGCGRQFADPAALGEADNRARALAAGWCVDAYRRLACPVCRGRHGLARLVPGPRTDPARGQPPANTSARAPGNSQRAGRRSAAGAGRHRRTLWPHLLAALANNSNGWAVPRRAVTPQRGPRAGRDR